MENNIKTTIQNFSLSILIFIIAGCAVTNENKQQSNLKTPEQNNSFISGVVKGDKYIAMDNSFVISLPFKKGSREYELMEIDEFYHENGVSVAFGAIGNNKNLFKLEIIKNETPDDFESNAKKLLSAYQNDLQRNYRSKAKLLKRHRFQIHGYDTVHWNLLQKVNPSRVSGLNYGLLNHQVFAINYQDKIVFIWVQKTADKANRHNKVVTAYDFATSINFIGKDTNMNLLSSLR